MFGPLLAWILLSALLAVNTGMNPEKLDPQRLLGVPGVFGLVLMLSYLVGAIPGALAGLAFVALRGAGPRLRLGGCMLVAATTAGFGLSLLGTNELVSFISGFVAGGVAAGLIGWMETALGKSSTPTSTHEP